MSTHAHDGGLRPALPPTLQPMAIALSAPRTDKRTALIASGVVYLLVPAALFALGRVIPTPTFVKTSTKGDDAIYEALPVQLGGGATASQPIQTSALPRLDPNPSSAPIAEPQTETNLEALVPEPGLPTSFAPSTGGTPNTTGVPTGPTSSTSAVNPQNVGTRSSNSIVQISSDAVRILHQEVPVYPALARVSHVQGDVLVRMVIDANGIPTSVQVEQGHPALRAAAEQSARLWRFSAAHVNGQAVPATFLLTLKFRLS